MSYCKSVVLLCLLGGALCAAGPAFGAATTDCIYIGGPSASDENSGETWGQAVATLARAAELVTADEAGELKEVRIAGDINATATTPVFKRAITIRGGFAGTESTDDQRPLGKVSTVNGQGKYRFLNLQFTEGDTVIDSLTFTDGLAQALKITGGAGATVTLTNVAISACRHRQTDAAQYEEPGAAIWAGNLGELRMIDCRITDCGPLTMAEVAGARQKSNTGAIHLSSTPVTAVGCVFAGNRSAARINAAGYGSTIRIVDAAGASAFTRCAFYGNRAMADTCGGDYDDTGALYFAPSSNGATLAIDFCTFANNAAYFGNDGASLAVKKGTVTVTHSIFAGSVKKSKSTSAVEISVESGATLNIGTTLFPSKAVSIGGSGTIDYGVSETVLEGEPTFTATAPVTWDTTSSAFAQTARNPVLDWTKIDVVPQDGSLGACWGAYPNGEPPDPSHLHVWGDWTTNGVTCVTDGTRTRTCEVADCPVKTETEPVKAWGHDWQVTGEDANYRYFACSRCEATKTEKRIRFVSANGTGDGSDWDHATSLAAALAAVQDGDEIWIKGDLDCSASSYPLTVDKAIAIRGGFAGTETAESGRTDGAVSTLDGGGKNASYTADARMFFKVTLASGKVTFDALVLQNGGCGAVRTSGTSVETELVFSNCTFRDNFLRVNSAVPVSGSGSAIYAATLKALMLTDCRFICNGVPDSAAYSTLAAIREGGAVGTALYVSGAPVTALRCEFVGNATCSHNQGGSAFYLGGACSGSTFSNCAFVGNRIGGNTGNANTNSGILMINLTKIADTCDFNGCTFAYNYSRLSQNGISLRVSKGTVTVDKSVFFGASYVGATSAPSGAEVARVGSATDATIIVKNTFVPSESALSDVSVKSRLVTEGNPCFEVGAGTVSAGNTKDANWVLPKFGNPAVTALDVHFTDATPNAIRPLGAYPIEKKGGMLLIIR